MSSFRVQITHIFVLILERYKVKKPIMQEHYSYLKENRKIVNFIYVKIKIIL